MHFPTSPAFQEGLLTLSTCFRCAARAHTFGGVPNPHIAIAPARNKKIRRGIVVQTEDPLSVAFEKFMSHALF